MPCEERDKLLDLFLEAAKAHSDAVHVCLGRHGEALERLTALAESARKIYEDCHHALDAHPRLAYVGGEAFGHFAVDVVAAAERHQASILELHDTGMDAGDLAAGIDPGAQRLLWGGVHGSQTYRPRYRRGRAWRLCVRGVLLALLSEAEERW
jgi:hypothetical protein